MNKTKLLPLFVIVAVAAMMGAASIAPTYAAQKTTDTHDTSEVLAGGLGAQCGSASTNLFVKSNSFTKVWDNGKMKTHASVKFTLYDVSTGVLVGTIPGQVINFQGDTSALPISIQINAGGTGTCTDGTPLPFQIIEPFHCGFTVQRDGDVIAHNVACDFD